MTSPFNHAEDGSRVAVQTQIANIQSVTLPGGNVQLTVGLDATAEDRYLAGVENIRSGNAIAARRLIWDAMMHGCTGSEIRLHWLVAMLSGRTRQQFSDDEIKQVKMSRARGAGTETDPWADGVRLIDRLFDSAPPLAAADSKRRPAEEDMRLLVKQVEDLPKTQRDLIRPHLDIFLTGPLMDETWQKELDRADDGRLSGNRLGRAWMFFQPVPAEVALPAPRPAQVSDADRLAMRAGLGLVVLAAGYLGWELLWHGAVLGLLSYAAALAGSVAAAKADLKWRFRAERLRQKEDLLRTPEKPAPSRPCDETAGRVDVLFRRYFTRYELDDSERERWETAAAGICKFHKDEITKICQTGAIPADRVAWLIRHEIRRMHRLWREGHLHDYRQELAPQTGTVATRWIGLAVLAAGGVWSIGSALRAHLLAVAVALAIAYGTWRLWRRVCLERWRYAADSEEHEHRQEEVENEFKRWSKVLEARPKDAEMAAWLELDRTILLGTALKHFQVLRSHVLIHAFLEQPGVAKRRAQIEDGPWRYAAYRLHVIVLAEDGVRQVRAHLDFTKAALTIRERTSYSYDSIIAVRFLQETRRQTFELRLAAGDPIMVRVRDADPGERQPDQDASQTEEAQQTAGPEADASLDEASMTDLLNMLEKVAGQGRSWPHGQDRMTA